MIAWRVFGVTVPTQPTIHFIIRGSWPSNAHMTAFVSASGTSTADNFVVYQLKAWLFLRGGPGAWARARHVVHEILII